MKKIIYMRPKWSIKLENDSGRWILLLHIMADGKQCGVAQVGWFGSREDAESVLEEIEGR